MVKKNETPQFCEPLPGEPLTQIKIFFKNRTKKSCRIRRWFEQLSSYSGWRVITKKTSANKLAHAVVRLCFYYKYLTKRDNPRQWRTQKIFMRGFIQWHMVVICIWRALLVTSQFDVIAMFPNQRFGEVS